MPLCFFFSLFVCFYMSSRIRNTSTCLYIFAAMIIFRKLKRGTLPSFCSRKSLNGKEETNTQRLENLGLKGRHQLSTRSKRRAQSNVPEGSFLRRRIVLERTKLQRKKEKGEGGAGAPRLRRAQRAGLRHTWRATGTQQHQRETTPA